MITALEFPLLQPAELLATEEVLLDAAEAGECDETLSFWETPTHFIAMGLHTDLDEAAKLAVQEAIDFLVEEKGIPRDDAYVLCSIGVDLHVTQLVDGTKGIHAMIPKSIFK